MLKFGGKMIPDFIRVNSIEYSVLPEVETKTQSVLGRGGVYDFGIDLGNREISAEIQIIGENENDIINKAREFSEWLFYEDLQPLIIMDEPNKQYMARISGSTTVSELAKVGSTTLTFLCPSPYAESITPKNVFASPLDLVPVQVVNEGTAITHPQITLTIKEDTPSIAVISDDSFIQLGREETDEVTATTKVNEVVFYDQFTNIGSGWTDATYVDKGIVAGRFNVNPDTGSTWVVDNDDYGTYHRWHGPAMKKSLDMELQDFYVWGNVSLRTEKGNEMGRVEIYLLDINDNVIGKLSLIDGTNVNKNLRFEARAGDYSNGTTFAKTYGARKGIWNEENMARVIISRTGNEWYTYMAVMDEYNRPHRKIFRQTWYDTDELYSTQKLAKIQIHIGAYNDFNPVSRMWFGHLEVDNRNQDYDRETETPVLFKAGDEVVIDNEGGIVFHNGQSAYHILDPSSDFIPLEKGSNGLIVSPPVADISIDYKEKWL